MKNRINLAFLLVIFAISFTSFGQSFLTPSNIISDGAIISITDVVKDGEIYKFRLSIENSTGDHYFAYSLNQTIFDFPNMGEVRPNGREILMIIPPGKKKFVIINAKVGEQSFFPRFELFLNGLYKGKISTEGLSNESTAFNDGKTQSLDFGTVHLNFDKIFQKKGTFKLQGEATLDGSVANPKELLYYDPKDLGIENVTDGGKSFVVYPGGKKKVKIEVAYDGTNLNGVVTSAFKRINLESVQLDPLVISDGSKVYQTCDSQTAKTNGNIKIQISSNVGCFKFDFMGESLTPAPTSNLTFFMNASVKKVKVTMDNGFVIEKSIYAKDDYKALYYEVREKDNKYVLRYLPGASELADGRSAPITTSQQGGGTAMNMSYGETCPPVDANTSGTTLVKINSEVGCFDFYLLGQKLTPSPTSNFSFRMSSSGKKVKVKLANGITIEKLMILGEGYETVYYSVIKKRDKYVLKQHLAAAELSPTATNNHQKTCEDVITDVDFNQIRNVTIMEITMDKVFFKSCGSEVLQSISKYDILETKYADGTCDKFDYNGGNKQGLRIVRGQSEMVDKHTTANYKQRSCSSSYIIGPNK